MIKTMQAIAHNLIHNQSHYYSILDQRMDWFWEKGSKMTIGKPFRDRLWRWMDEIHFDLRELRGGIGVLGKDQELSMKKWSKENMKDNFSIAKFILVQTI
jgi:hypothetical protein